MKNAFTYPLRVETLSTGLVFYVAFSILFALYQITSGPEPGFRILWLVMSGSALLVYLSFFFDYGMEILRLTVEGKPNPPVFSVSRDRLLESSQRLFRQLVLVGMFATLGRQLNNLGWTESAWVVWLALFLLLPTFFINNTLYGSVNALLNPVTVLATLRNLGWTNLPILLLLALIVALTWFCLTGQLLGFLALFPLVLYGQFLFFHVLGLCVHARTERFFVQVDFKADRKESTAISDSLADINGELSEAHELLRAGQHAEVRLKLEQLLQRNGLDDFERAFSYISEWFDRGPAVHLCRWYLDRDEAFVRPMRSFELAEWALAHDAGFTLQNPDSLRTLAACALTPEHYRTVLQLLENHLKGFLDSPHRAELVALALNLAGDKLKDEARYVLLKETWAK